MIRIEKYSAEKHFVWDRFVENSRTPMFMFKRDYMEYHQDRFFDCSLMAYDDDSLVAIMPANRNNNELISHGGLTFGGLIVSSKLKQTSNVIVFEEIFQFLKKQGISYLKYKKIPHVYSLIPAEEDEYSLFKLGAKLLKIEPSTVIDLKNPLKMPKGRKAQISRAKREGVEVEELDDKKSFDQFFEIENSVLAERHNTIATHTSAEMFLLKSRFPDNIHLFAGIYDEKIIAGTIIYEYQNLIHTQYMGANGVARQIGALDLVNTNIIEEYREKKKWLDFGISSEENGLILNEGLISQKEGFGGRTNIYETWEISF